MLKLSQSKVRALSTREQARQIRTEALSVIEKANEFSTATRKVSKRAAYKVISRSLKKSKGLPFSIRKHQALTELSNYISLAKYNKVVGLTAFNTDLLPVTHPRSTKLTSMSASAMYQARIKWITDDPRITDDTVKTLIASAMSAPYDSAERTYALTRLENMPQGLVPLEALTAAIGDGNSSIARAARVALQWRDRLGRWVEMYGALGGRKRRATDGMRTYVQRADGTVRSLSGVPVGQNIFSNSLADIEVGKGKIASVPIRQSEGLDAYLRDPASVDGYSPVPADPKGAPVINESDIAFSEAPSTFRKDNAYKGVGTKYTDDAYDVYKFANPKEAQKAIDEGMKRAAELDKPAPNLIKKGETDADTGKQFWDPEEPVFALHRRGKSTPLSFTQTWKDTNTEIMKDEPEYYAEEGKEYSLPDEPDDNTVESDVALADRKDEFDTKKKKRKTEESKPSTPAGFKYKMPEGAYDVDPNYDYVPEGDQDDPSMLSAMQSTEELTDALADAVTPEGGQQATGLGRLTDENGEEFEVPAEAIVSALKEQGEDTELSLAKIYDGLNGNNDNEKALTDSRKGKKKEKAAEPKELDEIFDEVTETEPEVVSAEPETEEAPVDEADAEEEERLNLEDMDKIPALAGLSDDEKKQVYEDNDYSKYIPKNKDIDLPEGMYKPKESTPEDRKEALSLASQPKSTWPVSELMDGLNEAMKNGGASAVLGLDENKEWVELPVTAEAWRDAIALRGKDPNETIQKIADGTFNKEEESAAEKRDQRKGRKKGKGKGAPEEDRADQEGTPEPEAEVIPATEEEPEVVSAEEEAEPEVVSAEEEQEPEVISAEEEKPSGEKSWREIEEEEYGKYAPLPKELPQGWTKTRGGYNEAYYMPQIENEDGTRIVGTYGKDGEKDAYWSIMDAPFDVPDKLYKTSEEALKDYEKYKAEAEKAPVEEKQEPTEPPAEEPTKEEGEAEVPPTEPPAEEPAAEEEKPKRIIKYKRAGRRTLFRGGKGKPFGDTELVDFLVENGFEWSNTVERDGKTVNVKAYTKLQDEEEFKDIARQLRDRFDIDIQPQPATPNAPAQEPIDIDAPTPEIEPVGKPEAREDLPEKIEPVGEIPEPEIIVEPEPEPKAAPAPPPPPPPNDPDKEFVRLLIEMLYGKIGAFPTESTEQTPGNMALWDRVYGKSDEEVREILRQEAERLGVEWPTEEEIAAWKAENEALDEEIRESIRRREEKKEAGEESSLAEDLDTETSDKAAAEEAVNEAIADTLADPEKAYDIAGLIRNFQRNRAKSDGALANPFGLNRKEMISRLMWFKWGAGAEKNESPYMRKVMKDYRKKLEGLSNEDLVKMLNLIYDEMDAREEARKAALEKKMEEQERQRKLKEIRDKKRREKEDKLLEEEEGKKPEEAEEATPEEKPEEAPEAKGPWQYDPEKDMWFSPKKDWVFVEDGKGKGVWKLTAAGRKKSPEDREKIPSENPLAKPKEEEASKPKEEETKPEGSVEPTSEPEAKAPVKTSVRGGDLQPGDVLSKDHFTVTNVEPGLTKTVKGQEVPASRVTGYYPGSVEQASKLWADDTMFEIFRGVTPPEKGDLPELRQPKSEDFADRKDYLAARAKYDEELAKRRAMWTPPEDVTETEAAPIAPKTTAHVVTDIPSNLKPGDIAFTFNDDTGEAEAFFVVTSVDPEPREYVRPKDGKKEIKTIVRGFYPGHQEQEVDWNQDTSISVIRGESPDLMPKPGDKEPILRIPNGTLSGAEYSKKRAEIVAARREAGKAYKPSITPQKDAASSKSSKISKKPFRPFRPAFLGSAADIAKKLRDGAAIWEALKGEKVVFFDFETIGTGKFDHDNPDAPIQLAASIWQNGKKIDEINLFINPGVPLDKYYYSKREGKKEVPYLDENGNVALNPDRIIDNNGVNVTDEWLATQPSIEEQLRKFAEFIGENAILVAQNAEFDTNTFEVWAKKFGIPYKFGGVIDTAELSRSLGYPKNGLSEIAERYGITKDPSFWHNAAADSEVLPEILEKLLKEMKSDNKEFDTDARAEEFKNKLDKYFADLASWEAQQKADQVTPKPASFGPDGSTDKYEEVAGISVFGDAINEAWVVDDENTYVVNEARSIVVDELRVGDFIQGMRGVYREIIDIQVDPENPNKLLVYRRDLTTGKVYVNRVTDSATPGLGWARDRELEGEIRRRHGLKGKSGSEIQALVPKPAPSDPTPQIEAEEKPVKGADLTDEQVNSVVADAIETITSGAKPKKKVKEAVKDLNIDETTKKKVIEREGGSPFHPDANGVPLKVGDRVRHIKTGEYGYVRAFISEYGPDKRKNYLKVIFDGQKKRNNAASKNLELVYDDGGEFTEPTPTPPAKEETAPEAPMNMGMALPSSDQEFFSMAPLAEEGSEVPNALPEDNYEYTGEKFPPTSEQRNVLTAIMTGENVVVRALAGTGKTSTLTLAARRILDEKPKEQIVYVAFNKTVQEEAAGKMPPNVESRTGDSIAYQGVDSALRDKFLAQRKAGAKLTLRATDIAEKLGIKPTGVKIDGSAVNLNSMDIAAIVKNAIGNFSISADDEVGAKHFSSELEEVPRSFVEYARAYWDDILDPNGTFSINNAHLTKIWALSNPDLSAVGSGLKKPATIIFFDEAQDINPVIAKVIADQKIQKVYVGDGNQAIYAFRGAEDQLDKTTAKWDLPLTKSFRFGPEIAGVANRYLAKLGSKYRVEGAGSKGEIGAVDDPDVVITRTNAGGFRAMIELLDSGKSVLITEKHKEELESLVDTAAWLMNNKDPKFKPKRVHADLVEFDNWAEWKESVEKGENKKTKALYDIIVQNSIQTVRDILKRVNVARGEEADLKPASGFKKITLDQAEEGSKGSIGEGINYEVKDNAIRLSGNGTFKGKDLIKSQGFRWDVTGKQWYKEVDDDLDRQKAINDLRRVVGGFAPDEGEGEEGPQVLVTTAHKSKGLQWNNVRIFDDFWGPRTNKKTGELEMPADEELRLAYVALTRAQKKLDPGTLSWIYEYTDEEDELPKKPTSLEQNLGMALPTESVTEEEFAEDVKEAAEKIDPATEKVANAIIAALEKGVAPWRKPWTGGGFLPTSVATGKPYEGSNVLVLWAAMELNGWTDNRFLTYKQAEKLNGNVKKGEKGTQIIHWQPAFKEVEKPDGTKEKVFVYRPPKVITVFNVAQTENVNLPALVKGEPVPVTDAESNILESYKDKPEIINKSQDQAYWSPLTDTINLPLREQFKTEKEYFETLVHELAHSTGHSKRLDRKDLLDNYGKHLESRGEEELIAEITVALVAARLGVEIDFENVAAYAQNWLQPLKNDKSMIVKAAKQAQKAVDYMLGKAEALEAPETPETPVGEGIGSEGRTGEEISAEPEAAPEVAPEPNVGTEGQTGEEIAEEKQQEEPVATGVASIKGEYQKGIPNKGDLKDGMTYEIKMDERVLNSGRTNGGTYGVRKLVISGNTYSSREALKEAKFSYDPKTKTWFRSYLGKVFPVKTLTQDILNNNPDLDLPRDIQKFSE